MYIFTLQAVYFMKHKHNKCVRLLETESVLIELGLSVTPLLFGKDID